MQEREAIELTVPLMLSAQFTPPSRGRDSTNIVTINATAKPPQTKILWVFSTKRKFCILETHEIKVPLFNLLARISTTDFLFVVQGTVHRFCHWKQFSKECS